MAVPLPSGNQMDVQVRDPLPARRAVVLPDREPVRPQPLAEQPATDLTVTISAAAVSSSRSQMLST